LKNHHKNNETASEKPNQSFLLMIFEVAFCFLYLNHKNILVLQMVNMQGYNFVVDLHMDMVELHIALDMMVVHIVVVVEELVVEVAYMDMVVPSMAFASLVVGIVVVEVEDMVVQHIQEFLELEQGLELDMVLDMVDIVELEVVLVMEEVGVEELDKDRVALHMESSSLVVHTSLAVEEVVEGEGVLDMDMAELHMAFASLVEDIVVGVVEAVGPDMGMVVLHMVLDNMVVDMLHLQLLALALYTMVFVHNNVQTMLDMHIVHLLNLIIRQLINK
jgi:hypothetical protein